MTELTPTPHVAAVVTRLALQFLNTEAIRPQVVDAIWTVLHDNLDDATPTVRLELLEEYLFGLAWVLHDACTSFETELAETVSE